MQRKSYLVQSVTEITPVFAALPSDLERDLEQEIHRTVSSATVCADSYRSAVGYRATVCADSYRSTVGYRATVCADSYRSAVCC